ncbi:MFS transporter [Chloroflexota bacterium]
MAETKKQGFFYGYIIVIACFVMMVMWWGSFHSFAVFFEPLLNEFGWSRAITAGTFSTLGLLFGLYSIPIARLCNIFSPRFIIGGCGFLGGLGYILMSQVNAIWQMYLFYGVLIAIGMGGYISILPIVARWFVHKRGLMTGIVFSGMGIGMVVVPPLVSKLIEIYGWRIAYVIIGAVTMAGVVIGSQFLKRDPAQTGYVPSHPNDVTRRPVMSDVSYKQSLRKTQFWILGALYFVYLISHNVATVHIVIYATGLGISPLNAASLLSIFGIFLIAGFNIIGIASDKIGNKNGFIISFIAMTLAFIVILSTTEPWILYLFVIILGFACGGMQMLFSPTVAELFGLRSHGEILATAGFMGGIGSAVGAAMAGYVFDVTGNYSLAFAISAVLSAVAILLSWRLKPLFQNKTFQESERNNTV